MKVKVERQDVGSLMKPARRYMKEIDVSMSSEDKLKLEQKIKEETCKGWEKAHFIMGGMAWLFIKYNINLRSNFKIYFRVRTHTKSRNGTFNKSFVRDEPKFEKYLCLGLRSKKRKFKG